MIVDAILDRKDGIEYNAKEFYDYVREYNLEPYSSEICEAMDEGNNQDVQFALCKYIVLERYSLNICGFIQDNKWI